MPRERLKYKTKSEIAMQEIKEMIRQRELLEDSKYSFTEIAQKLSISRTPVAKAVMLLEEQGIVTIAENNGFFVHYLTDKDLEEINLIRTQLMKVVARFAIERCTEEDYASLYELNDQVRKSISEEDEEAYYRLSYDFDILLSDLAGAERCKKYFERNVDYEGWYTSGLLENKPELLQMCTDHDEILNALEEKDLEKAELLMEKHNEHCLLVLNKLVPAH